MKPAVRDYVLGMAVGAFFGAMLGMFCIGLVVGARLGAYLKFKFDERGQMMTHASLSCKPNGGSK